MSSGLSYNMTSFQYKFSKMCMRQYMFYVDWVCPRCSELRMRQDSFHCDFVWFCLFKRHANVLVK